ncbi:hypothetical protein PS2_026254 [Malus domestica]
MRIFYCLESKLVHIQDPVLHIGLVLIVVIDADRVVLFYFFGIIPILSPQSAEAQTPRRRNCEGHSLFQVPETKM